MGGANRDACIAAGEIWQVAWYRNDVYHDVYAATLEYALELAAAVDAEL